MTTRADSRSWLALAAVVLVIASAVGPGLALAATPAAAAGQPPAGMAAVDGANINDIRPSSAPTAVEATDLYGAVYVGDHAATTEVDIVTGDQAREVAKGASPADVAYSAACETPAGVSAAAFAGCDQQMALVISDDMNHAGREVAVRVDVVEEALGYVPETIGIANNETGETYSAPATVEDGWLVASVEHFSSNSVSFEGTISIQATPAQNGDTFTTNISDLDSASNFTINVTGRENTHNETVVGDDVGPSSIQSVSVGGTNDPYGPSVNNKPTVEVSLPIESVGSVSGTALNSPTSVAVGPNGDYAYVASGANEKLTVVNITDPTAPSVEGSVTDTAIGGGKSVQAGPNGNYVYTVGDGSGHKITSIDVSTKSSPVVADFIQVNYNPEAIAVAGNYAYVVGDYQDEMWSVDISTPSNMSIADNIAPAEFNGPKDIAVNGSYAYVANKPGDSVAVVDISTPSTLSVSGSVSDATALNGSVRLAADGPGDYVVVSAAESDRVTTVDVTTATSPVVDASVTDAAALGTPSDIAVESGYAYVRAAGPSNYTIVDVTNMSAPRVVETYGTGGPLDAGPSYTAVAPGGKLTELTKYESVSSLSVDDGQTNSASFGSLETGETVTKELALSVAATELNWSGSGDPLDYSLSMEERTVSEDIVIGVNADSTSYSGKLSPGSTASLNTNTSWLVEGQNNISVTVGDALSADAPTPLVDLDYQHDAKSVYNVNYSAEALTVRYDVGKEFTSDQSDVQLNISFDHSVYEMRDIEKSVNGGTWSAVSSSNYRITPENKLVVNVGSVTAGDTVQVRANGSRIRTHNMTIVVEEPTTAGDPLDSKVRIDSMGENAHLTLATSGNPAKLYYPTLESWSSPKGYVEILADGTQSLYLPNAAAGETFRLKQHGTKVEPESNEVEVEVVDSGVEPKLRVIPGATDGDNVAFTYYNTETDYEYVLYSRTHDVQRDSGTANSPVTLLDDDSLETLEIFEAGSTTSNPPPNKDDIESLVTGGKEAASSLPAELIVVGAVAVTGIIFVISRRTPGEGNLLLYITVPPVWVFALEMAGIPIVTAPIVAASNSLGEVFPALALLFGAVAAYGIYIRYIKGTAKEAATPDEVNRISFNMPGSGGNDK